MRSQEAIVIISKLGWCIVSVLNSSDLKDKDNLLYHKLKNAAALLMNADKE